LAYLGEALRITERHLVLVAQSEAVARGLYAAGAGKFADVLKAQVEADLLADRITELTDARGPAAAELNAALGRAVTEPLAWPVGLPHISHAVAEDSLVADLLARHPQLVALGHQQLGSSYAIELAGRQKYPDFTLGIDYIVTGPAVSGDVPDSGQDPVVARLAINVPIWWGKYKAAEREAAGRRRQLDASRRDVTVGLSAELERLRFELREAERTAELYGGTLVAKGQATVASIGAAYETGQAGYLEVVEAQRTLLAFELTEARARTDRLRSLARIEQLIARPVPTAAPHQEIGTAHTRENDDVQDDHR
jgi:outer membrane protein TolC